MQEEILKSLHRLKLLDSDLSTGYSYPAFGQLEPGEVRAFLARAHDGLRETEPKGSYNVDYPTLSTRKNLGIATWKIRTMYKTGKTSRVLMLMPGSLQWESEGQKERYGKLSLFSFCTINCLKVKYR